jgi:tetratricopeptide (TPR) repeat protein
VGETLSVGDVVRATSGRAAIQLPFGSTALLSSGAELELARLDRRDARVRLEEGAALFSVTRRSGQERFRVVTDHGTFTVRGTVFAVAIERDGARLTVFRGAVEASSPKGGTATATRGQEIVLTSGTETVEARPARTAADPETSPEASRLGSGSDLQLLTFLAATRSARLHIRSRPAGATVLLDGAVMGKTPLEATVHPAHRRLELTLRGKLAYREYVTLEPGEEVKRDLDLAFRLAMDVPSAEGLAENGRPAGNERPAEKTHPAEGPKSKSPINTKRPASPSAGGDDDHKAGGDDTAKPSPEKTSPARKLLLEAQRLRAQKSYAQACRAYRRLIRKYPASPEARAGQVSLGLILLGPSKKPAEALRWLNRYLAVRRTGLLAQEALYGKIRALRALGKTQREIKASRKFLAGFPNALQAGHVKRRLRQLGALPEKPDAKRQRPGTNPKSPGAEKSLPAESKEAESKEAESKEQEQRKREPRRS